MEKHNIREIVSKSDIYIENEIISKELIIKTFADFLCSASDKSEHNVGFVLHTGSVCFEACAVVYAAVTCLLNNMSSANEVISSLQIDDLVTYTLKTRPIKAKFKGFFTRLDEWGFKLKATDSIKNATDIIIESEKTRSRSEKIQVPKQLWNRISPYYGKSGTTDGRGLKRKSGMRDEFYKDVIGCPQNEIPSVVNVSCALVIRKAQADYLMNNIQIGFNNKKISLLEFEPPQIV